MSAPPTVAVTVDLFSMLGVAYPGVEVSAKLDKNDRYGSGFVIAETITVVTDENSRATFHLFPNNPTTGLGTTGSVYTFRASPKGGKNWKITAQIPNQDCSLEDVADAEIEAPLSAAQIANSQAQAAAAAAAAGAADAAAAAAVYDGFQEAFAGMATDIVETQAILAGQLSEHDEFQLQLVSGVNIKTVNGNSLLGPGDLVIAGGGGGGGGLASVGLSVPAGLQVAGSPLVADGTLAITYQAGYSMPTTAKQGQWDTAYEWGDHGMAGYLSSIGLTVPVGLQVAGSPLTEDGTLLVSFAAGYSIPTTAMQEEWDTAYSWGNHSLAGYISSIKTINGQTLVGAGNIVINDGVDGTDGKTVHNGTGAPSNALGVDGDFYIDTAAALLYGPKAAGVWPAGVSLVGPEGPSGLQPIVDIYGAAGTYTWSKDPNAKVVKVYGWGGGGGGGSGARGPTSAARSGGGAGSSAAFGMMEWPATTIASSVSVVVGAGGVGGASRTSDAQDGAAGTAGAASSFGSYLVMSRGNNGSGGVRSGSTATGGGAPTGFPDTNFFNGASGGAGAIGAGSTATVRLGSLGATGGGGGAGAAASSTTGANGGNGGNLNAAGGGTAGLGSYAAAAGGLGGVSASSTPANAGVAGVAGAMVPGTGGGGGYYKTGAPGGAGATGGSPGGGGGGGGASDDGFASGSGGNGGEGCVVVIQW